MHPLAILDPADPGAARERGRLGAAVGSALRAATTDPARMLPLWTAFSRGEPVRAQDLRGAISERFLDDAVRLELLVRVDVGDDEPWLRGSVCIVAANVAGELLWVTSDFGWYDEDPAAVTGPGAASETLLAAVPEGRYPRVLDMGCGSGAIGVRLVGSAGQVLTSSDVNPRALALTELTAALNGRTVRTVHSDFAADVTGSFDLVVCNPPFVIGRPEGRTTFRDSADDSGHSALGHSLAPLLADGGLALYLANWEYRIAGPDPLDQLGQDLAAIAGCDVLVLERAVVPVAEYVAVWSHDAAEQRDWVGAFTDRHVGHVGSGIVALVRTSAAEHTVTLAKDFDTPRDLLGGVVRDWRATGISQT